MKIVILVTLMTTIAVLAELGSARISAAVALKGKKSHRLRGLSRK